MDANRTFRSIPVGLALGALFAVVAALAPGPARACSCIESQFGTSYEWSEAIFMGVVQSVEPIDAVGDGHFARVAVQLTVSQTWKGVTAPARTIFTPTSSAACGSEFDVGREYLVYADASYDEPGSFWSGLCNRTHPSFPGDPDLVLLGSPGPVPTIPASWGGVKATYR